MSTGMLVPNIKQTPEILYSLITRW